MASRSLASALAILLALGAFSSLPPARADERVTLCRVDVELAGAGMGSTTCPIPTGARAFRVETACSEAPVAAQVVFGLAVPWALFRLAPDLACAVEIDHSGAAPDPNGMLVAAQGSGSLSVSLTAEVRAPTPPPPPPPPPTVTRTTQPGGARWVTLHVTLDDAAASFDLYQVGGVAPSMAGHHVYAYSGDLSWWAVSVGSLGGWSPTTLQHERTAVYAETPLVSEHREISPRGARHEGGAGAGIGVGGTGYVVVGLWVAGDANETVLVTALEPNATVAWMDEGDDTFVRLGSAFEREGPYASAYVASLGGHVTTSAGHHVARESHFLAEYWPAAPSHAQRIWVEGPDGIQECPFMCEVVAPRADHAFRYSGAGLGIYEIDAPFLAGAFVRLPL